MWISSASAGTDTEVRKARLSSKKTNPHTFSNSHNSKNIYDDQLFYANNYISTR